MDKILTIEQIAAACCATIENCDENIIVSDVTTDSRKISKGAVFVALRGEKFDGHSFVAQALEAGAVCCVVDSAFENTGEYATVVVENTYKALRDVASLYRRKFAIPSVAVTGSVGKTSTKDMISSVLEENFRVLKTEGNFNNEIGLPLTVFRIGSDHQIAVFEMGMSAFGEISRLTRIAAPETAVITNIGFSHIEHLGSQENILKAKLEILEGMSETEGTVILNGDDKFLRDVAEKLPFDVLTYGIENPECDILAKNINQTSSGTDFQVERDGEKFFVSINTPGIHHVYNALAAILAGRKYGMPMEKIIKGISEFRPQGMRQRLEALENYVIIRDCYNASPTSMKSGLEVLSVAEPKKVDEKYRRVAILGDMLELGDFAEEAHTSVGKLVCDYDVSCLIAVGPNGKFVARGAESGGFDPVEIHIFDNNDEAKTRLAEILHPNDIVLLKGSRGMHLEELADFIAEFDAKRQG